MKNRPRKKDRETLREEALRPSPYIGFDHDRIALHLVEREAYAIAEKEFRRAIWLNPFEPAFRMHLAWCLFRQGRMSEAEEVLAALAGESKMEVEREELLKLVRKKAP